MNPISRRKEMMNILKKEEGPISARKLAGHFEVSRQVIVGDIALLRAEGQEILSTPNGYVYESEDQKQTNHFIGKVVCQHSAEQTEKELEIIVDNGGEVVNVEIEHPVYGVISSSLRIRSRHDIQQFLKEMDKQKSSLLASLTNGIHLHTIHCEDEVVFQRIKDNLEKAGILYDQLEA